MPARVELALMRDLTRVDRPEETAATRGEEWRPRGQTEKFPGNPRKTAGIGGYPRSEHLPGSIGYTGASVRNSSEVKRIEAAARFSSRWAIEEVPGIGSIAGDRCSSQASA